MAPRPSITAAELIQAATADPGNSMGKGTLTGLAQLRSDVPEVLTRRQAIPTRRKPKMDRSMPGIAVAPAPSANERRDLTAGEAAWIASLPTDPAEVSAKDASALAGLASALKSPAERRLVASRLDAVMARQDALQQLRHAEVDLAAMPHDADPTRSPEWPAWRQAIGARLRREVPELTESEAELRAANMVADAVQQASGSAERNQLRAQIGDIVRTHGIDASYFAGVDKWGQPGDDNRAEFRPDLFGDSDAA